MFAKNLHNHSLKNLHNSWVPILYMYCHSRQNPTLDIDSVPIVWEQRLGTRIRKVKFFFGQKLVIYMANIPELRDGHL